MRYDYICNHCSVGNDPTQWVVWEVSHPLNKCPKGMVCPKCNKGDKIERYIGNQNNDVRITGYGWLDVKGRRRDMNLWKLTNDDPYGGMRQPGEKDEMAAKFRKGGKFNSKPKHFLPSGSKKPPTK